MRRNAGWPGCLIVRFASVCPTVPLSLCPVVLATSGKFVAFSRFGLPSEWRKRERERMQAVHLLRCIGARDSLLFQPFPSEFPSLGLTHSLPSCPRCTRHDFIQSLFGNSKCKVKSTCLAASARTKCHFRFRQLFQEQKPRQNSEKKWEEQNCAQMKTL